MKITDIDALFILDKEYPPDPRVEGEIQALINNGLKIVLVTFSRDEEKGYFQDKFLCPVHKIRLKKITHKLTALAYTVPLYHLIVTADILRFVRFYKPKVIHVHDIRIARSVKWISSITGIPYILDLHENRPEIMKEYAFVKRFIGRISISLERWKENELKLIKSAKKTIVVTKSAAEYYMEQSNFTISDFIVTTNTTSDEFNCGFIRFNNQKIDDSLRLIYIGDTSERRGILDVLKALVLLKDKNIFFDILGSSSFDEHLISFIQQEQIGDIVKMHGWVGQKEIHEALSRADIGISPLIRNIHHDTTVANKLSQYSLYSLPIIVSNCTAQEELIQKYNCGFVFEAEDVKSLAKLLRKILRTGTSMNRLEINSKSMFNREFNNSKVYSELVEFYKQNV